MKTYQVAAIFLSFTLLTGCMTTKIQDPLDATGKQLLSSVDAKNLDDFKLTSSGTVFSGMPIKQGKSNVTYLIPQLSPINKASPDIRKSYDDGMGNVAWMNVFGFLGGTSVGGAVGLALVTKQWDSSQYLLVGGAAITGILSFVAVSTFDKAATNDFNSAMTQYNDYLDTLREKANP